MVMVNNDKATFYAQYAQAVEERQHECTHTGASGKTVTVTTKFIDGSIWVRCIACGTTWKDGIRMIGAKPQLKFDKTKRAAPDHYLQADTQQLDEKGRLRWYSKSWYPVTVASFAAAEEMVNIWNCSSRFKYKLPLHCERCYHTCSETFPSIGLEPGYVGMHVCSSCHAEGLENMKHIKLKKIAPEKFVPVVVNKHTHEEGDVWTLGNDNSPFGSRQWACQGSSKMPYVITQYMSKRDGAVTPEGWACSCKAFTQHSPRHDCKHVVRVKLVAGIAVPKTQGKMAKMSDDDTKAFEQWKRDQAEAKAGSTPVKEGGQKLNLFANTGRKFR